VPAIRMQLDYCGGMLLANPESGKMLTVSLWEDEQAMHDTDEAAHWMRGFGAQEAGGTVEAVDTYEVYRARMSRSEPALRAYGLLVAHRLGRRSLLDMNFREFFFHAIG
jgi:hypothetical protein